MSTSNAQQAILGPAGTPAWECDPNRGTTIQTGTMSAVDLVVKAEPQPGTPAPGYLKLYSPDGQSLQLLNASASASPIGFGAAYATVAGAGATVTGVTAETLLATGITVPAAGLAAGQVYHFVATGTITTTADTQTIDLRFRFGGLGGTVVIDFGTQNPDSSAVITGVAWRAEFNVIMTSATSMTVSAQDALNFFPTATTQQVTTVSNTTAKAFVLTVQPSATAVSMTCSAFSCERVA